MCQSDKNDLVDKYLYSINKSASEEDVKQLSNLLISEPNCLLYAIYSAKSISVLHKVLSKTIITNVDLEDNLICLFIEMQIEKIESQNGVPIEYIENKAMANEEILSSLKEFDIENPEESALA